jgi:hypothetical protein
MTYLQLVRGGDEFTRIPPACRGFEGKQEDNCSDGKNDPPEQVVELFILYHRKKLTNPVQQAKVQNLPGLKKILPLPAFSQPADGLVNSSDHQLISSSAEIVPWCKGSTRDFGSLGLGSNPGGTTFSPCKSIIYGVFYLVGDGKGDGIKYFNRLLSLLIIELLYHLLL